MTDRSPPPEAPASPASPKSPTAPESPQSPKTAEVAPSAPAQQPFPGPSTDVPNDAGILPASHWAPIEPVVDEADSAYSSEVGSTASMRSSIREYRMLHGRTYHREIGEAEAWEPNDEQHAESMDMQHHMCLLVLGDDRLHLAPLKEENLQKILDVGTGTGIWAIDMGDRYPRAEITGIDVSPIQPSWVPPNVRFELDDANLDWTWRDNTFDFIHSRMMIGTISDWAKYFREAFRCCKPGGWIESHEASFKWRSDTQDIPGDSAMGQWEKVFWEGGKKFGRTFRVVDDDLQQKYMAEAGFVDIVVKDIKVAFGDWPRDKQMKEAGRWAKMTLLADVEGYLLYMWNAVMGWSKEEIQVFIGYLKHQWNVEGLNPYFIRRVVYGRKPE
ncbi:hypothetical protein VTI74DRAFT_3423 [Chaetomium olivicolor]